METARRAGRELRFSLIQANMLIFILIITFASIIIINITMLRFPKEKRDILTLAAAQSENRTRARH